MSAHQSKEILDQATFLGVCMGFSFTTKQFNFETLSALMSDDEMRAQLKKMFDEHRAIYAKIANVEGQITVEVTAEDIAVGDWSLISCLNPIALATSRALGVRCQVRGNGILVKDGRTYSLPQDVRTININACVGASVPPFSFKLDEAKQYEPVPEDHFRSICPYRHAEEGRLCGAPSAAGSVFCEQHKEG